jgi:hypothetical protein
MKPLRSASYWARHKREKCWCSGYHFPPRRTGGACDHSPRRDYYIALRNGATTAEAMAELSAAQLERMFPHDLTELARSDDRPSDADARHEMLLNIEFR